MAARDSGTRTNSPGSWRLGGRGFRVISSLSALALLLGASCALPGRLSSHPPRAERGGGPRGAEALTPTAPGGSTNPFGVMLPSRVLLSSRASEVLRELGVVFVRPAAAFVEQWDGRCPECDAALAAGAKLVLTVRNSGRESTRPPSDLEKYKRVVAEIIDAYSPALLVVENEESSATFYAGTPDQYAAQLEAACEISHKKGVSCTNGGLVSTLVALLVYDNYLQKGEVARAEDFASRGIEQDLRRQLGSERAQQQIRKGKALLEAYRLSNADFINFHWYVADTKALEEAVEYLRSETGKPVITNEVGQLNDDPNQTTQVLAKIVELELPIAVWFGLDGPRARGLVNLDGSLRPTGEAFGRFVHDRFAS